MKKFGVTGTINREEKYIPGVYERMATRMARTIVRYLTEHIEKYDEFHNSRKIEHNEMRMETVYRLEYGLLNTDEVEAIEQFQKNMNRATPDDLPDIAVELWYKLNGWERD